MAMRSISELTRDKSLSHFSHFNLSKKDKSLSHLVTSTKRSRIGYTEQLARNKAQYLVDKLDNPTRFYFYLKCAWNLTDTYLDRLLGIALTKKRPAHYFSKAAAHEMLINK